MPEIIIGVHGLGNKPPARTLQSWWKISIREGLKRIGIRKLDFEFELFYWARYLHPRPLDRRIRDRKDPLYLEDPYTPAKKDVRVEKPGELRQIILDYVHEQLEKIFLNEDYSINYTAITDFIIHNFFSDLASYYSDHCVLQDRTDCRAKEVICQDLAAALRKHRRKKIMLIAHSMGSIIAYDVFTRYAPGVPVHTFVTVGSPLGLPIVKSKIFSEREKGPSAQPSIKTPESVTSGWYNLADLKDKIAVNYMLADDFDKNSVNVGPEDIIVANDYEFMGEKNPHKSYGYLRTPEMAEIVSGFLGV